MTKPALWKIDIYGPDSLTVACVTQVANEAPVFIGDVAALTAALPAITGLSRFFTDPDTQAKAAYQAYREGYEETFDFALPTWDQLKEGVIANWKKIATAAARVDSDLN